MAPVAGARCYANPVAAVSWSDDDQIAALVYPVAMINAATRLNVIVRQQGGSYEVGMFDAAVN
ncbi:hypothetical protein [Nocardia sp. NPDC005366]|uniref:hypothetical protein n=1 Tax=Nocardia sp. NPDC005366 TaxID=3156878 RepID=UPI0033B84DA5